MIIGTHQYLRMCIRSDELQQYWRRTPEPARDYNPPGDARQRRLIVQPGTVFVRGWPEIDAYPRACMVADVRRLDYRTGIDFGNEYHVPARLIDNFKPTPLPSDLIRMVRAAETGDEGARTQLHDGCDAEYVRIISGQYVRGQYSYWAPVSFQYLLAEDIAYEPTDRKRARHWVPHTELVARGPVDDDRVLHWVPRADQLQQYALEQAGQDVLRQVPGLRDMCADFAAFCDSAYVRDLFVIMPSEVWLAYVMWRLYQKQWVDREGQWQAK